MADSREVAEERVPEEGPRPAPVPPLPWLKRLYLLGSVAAVVLVTAFAWPRPRAFPADESCVNEFTSECVSAVSGTEVREPDSLWVNGAPLPEPRGRFALVSFDGRLYAIGGETPAGVTGSVVVYNPTEDAWSPAADKPTPAANLAAVVLDGRIYAIGGSTQQGIPLSAVEIFDPEIGTWTSAPVLPAAQTAHAAVAWKGKLYVVGGYNGVSYTGNVLVYDPEKEHWKQLPPMPTPRGFAGAAVHNNLLFLVGGYDGKREYAVCEAMDLELETWDSCPSMSTPRGGVGIAAVAGRVYVFGGGWRSFVTFSERFSPQSGVWNNLETPLLLAGGEWLNPGVAAIGTRVYAMGGWQGGRYLSVNQAFETLPNRLYLPAATGGGG